MANPSPKNHDPSIAALKAATEARLAEVEAGIFDPVVFTSKALVETTLPHSKRAGKELTLVNGDISVTMYSRLGLPYGTYPRLILMWLTREALRRRHLPIEEARVIPLCGSLTEFMRDIGIKTTSGGKRGTITTLREQMERLFTTTIGRDINGYSHDLHSRELENQLIAEITHLWWDPKAEGEVDFDGSITLSIAFYRELISSAVPLDAAIVGKLRRFCLALDLYAWLTYRMSYLRSITVVTWDQLRGQFGAGYPDTPQGKRDFKKKIRAAYARVIEAWPEVTAGITANGLMLKPGSPSVARKSGEEIYRPSADGAAPF